MQIRLIVPAFNCETTLRPALEALPDGLLDKVIVVDDGSFDNTLEVAVRMGVRVLRHAVNRGYGAAQKTGYRAALEDGADGVCLYHGDHQYYLDDPDVVFTPLENGMADAVLASRRLQGGALASGMPWWRLAGNVFLTGCQNRVLGLRLTDYHTGLRAYSRRLLTTVSMEAMSDDYVFDQQILVAARLKGLQLVEVPGRSHYGPAVQSISFGRSVRYGVQTLWSLTPAVGRETRP